MFQVPMSSPQMIRKFGGVSEVAAGVWLPAGEVCASWTGTEASAAAAIADVPASKWRRLIVESEITDWVFVSSAMGVLQQCLAMGRRRSDDRCATPSDRIASALVTQRQ